jgi:hypothetical protein
MSGCDKSLSHGSPVNAVAKDTGNEATHSLTSNASVLAPSNTPALTPEPKGIISALPNPINTGSSVLKIGLCVTAFIAFIVVTVLGVRRYFNPEIENIFLAPLFDDLEDDNRSDSDLISDGYKVCYWTCDESISLVWCCFKNITRRWCYYDIDTEKPIKEIPVKSDIVGFYRFYYKSELAPPN